MADFRYGLQVGNWLYFSNGMEIQMMGLFRIQMAILM